MAIAFVFARYLRLTQRVSVPLLVGYQTRQKLADPRSRKLFDFRRLGGDLVHDEVLLPQCADPSLGLHDPVALAAAGDRAETRRVRTWHRTRHPQGGLLLTQALPPDLELHLDEAIELVRRLAMQVRGSLHLPIHFAIHDPALRTSRAHQRNRHSHLIVYLRELSRAGFSRHKVRDLTARVRRPANSMFAHCVPEGISWPDLAWSVQETLFAECGLDLIVDPVAPASDVHWSELALSDEPPKMRARRDRQKRANLELINGKASLFIEALLRGRGTLRIAEIRCALEKQDLSASERDLRLAAILVDPEIITLGPAGATSPSHATTMRLHTLFTRADAIVQSSINPVGKPDNRGTILLMRGRDFGRVTDSLRHLVDKETRSAAMREHFIVDPRLSAIEGLWPDNPAIRLTLNEALGNAEDWTAKTIVVIPRTDQIADQVLAVLLVRAHTRGATLLLGYNEGAANGMVENRFAGHIASRIGGRLEVDETISARAQVARLLRAGLIPQAIERMQAAEHLRFAGAYQDDEVCGLAAQGAFYVTDDRTLARRIRLGGADSPEQCRGYAVPYEGRYVAINKGDPIVFTETDYSQRNVVRAGRVAWIDSIDKSDCAIVRDLAATSARIDLRSWRHIRPAHILAIREARRTTGLRLAIEVSVASTAWAALLLAADQEASSVRVTPQVARTVEELCTVIETSCVSPIASILRRIDDPRSEQTVRAAGILDSLWECGWETDPESFPTPRPTRETPQREANSRDDPSSDQMPQPTVRRTRAPAPPVPLDVRLRDRMAEQPLSFEGLWNLYCAISPGADGARETLTRIRPLIRTGTVLALLVESIADASRDRAPIKEAQQLDNLLHDFAHSSVAGFSDWEIYACVLDLSTMALASSRWGLTRLSKDELRDTPPFEVRSGRERE